METTGEGSEHAQHGSHRAGWHRDQSRHPRERDSPRADSHHLRETVPLGRADTLEEVARAAGPLCSAAASCITGLIVPTDGAEVAG